MIELFFCRFAPYCWPEFNGKNYKDLISSLWHRLMGFMEQEVASWRSNILSQKKSGNIFVKYSRNVLFFVTSPKWFCEVNFLANFRYCAVWYHIPSGTLRLRKMKSKVVLKLWLLSWNFVNLVMVGPYRETSRVSQFEFIMSTDPSLIFCLLTSQPPLWNRP